MKKIVFFLCITISTTFSGYSQEAGTVFAGVNIGGFFANKNTAIMYTGADYIASYGIEDLFVNIYNKPVFDTYFKYPYSIVELTPNPSYRPALDIGGHFGVNLGDGSSVYADLNFSNLKFENFFTVAIQDPNNLSPDPTYEQIPLFGEEKRMNINLGFQISVYNENDINVYFSLFGNINSTRLVKNFFIIDGKQYQIRHTVPNQPNVLPGGVGYGGGSGLGAKYRFNDKFTFDLAYSLYYTKIKMKADFSPFGIHNGITLRIIWG